MNDTTSQPLRALRSKAPGQPGDVPQRSTAVTPQRTDWVRPVVDAIESSCLAQHRQLPARVTRSASQTLQAPSTAGAKHDPFFGPLPTFADSDGWRWPHPASVAPSFLRREWARRTYHESTPGGLPEANLYGIVSGCAVQLWHEDGTEPPLKGTLCGDLKSHTQTTLQIIARGSGGWMARAQGVSSPAPLTTLYAALASAQLGRYATLADAQKVRRDVADHIDRMPGELDYVARTLVENHLQRCNPGELAALRRQFEKFFHPRPPSFYFEGQSWFHPDCISPEEIFRPRINRIANMGQWGAGLELEALAAATNTRICAWREPNCNARWRVTDERVQTCILTKIENPDGALTVHLVNDYNETHWQRFFPEGLSGDLMGQSRAGDVRIKGLLKDCGAGGDCLFLAFLGDFPGDRQAVLDLRLKTARYMETNYALFALTPHHELVSKWQLYQSTSRLAQQTVARLTQRADAYNARLRAVSNLGSADISLPSRESSCVTACKHDRPAGPETLGQGAGSNDRF